MTESAFIRASIKLIGLVFLIIGTASTVLNSLTATIQYTQANVMIRQMKSEEASERANQLAQGSAYMSMKRSAVMLVGRLPVSVFQIAIGLYLIKRPMRLTKWLLKEDGNTI